MWAVGCIFAELLTLKPLFQGQEVKGTPNPFQVNIFVLSSIVFYAFLFGGSIKYLLILFTINFFYFNNLIHNSCNVA